MSDTRVLEGGVIFPQLQEEMNAVNIQLLVYLLNRRHRTVCLHFNIAQNMHFYVWLS